MDTVHLEALSGRRDRAVLELRQEPPNRGWGTNIVLTIDDQKIVAMDEYRRVRKAHRVADVS